MNNNDLSPLLTSIGFKEKEARIYLALLELGKGDVSEIAKFSGIKRPTAYLIIEDLLEKGVISELPGRAIREFQAIDPSVILIKKRSDLKNFSEMIPFLQTLHNKGERNPRIQYIDTLEGIWNIYESLNYAKDVLCISSYKNIDRIFSNKVNFWIKGYEKKNYKANARHLIPPSEDEFVYGEKLKAAGQEVRIIGKKFDSDIVITENKIAISSLKGNPFLVLIESEKLATSLRPIFEIIWETSRNI